MIDYLVVILPAALGGILFFVKNRFIRRSILPFAAMLHFILTIMLIIIPGNSDGSSWVYYGSIGKFFLLISSILFLMTSFYTLSYLKEHSAGGNESDNENSENIFLACILVFFSTISLVAGAQNIGLLWVAMEATTLSSAPLIYFNRSRYSLEATWKYLLVCSIGIGLALLGNIFIEMSFPVIGVEPTLFVKALIEQAKHLNPLWLKIAFIFFLVGYGTKMGLAPMHTWLPDAHSEAPAMISALLSGTLLNCGLLGILRIHQVLLAAGLGNFSRELFTVFGLLSMLIAAIFIIKQTDFKRMLAYSSIENMGIISVGIGLGGEAVFGALLQIINHSFIKCALFLLAGNIYLHYRTRRVDVVSGVLQKLPVTGILWFAGFLAISAIPPFGTFVSEFLIIKHAFVEKQYLTIMLFILFLSAIFVGMSLIFIKMAFKGDSVACNDVPVKKESYIVILPSALLLSFALILGVYIPSGLHSILQKISSLI